MVEQDKLKLFDPIQADEFDGVTVGVGFTVMDVFPDKLEFEHFESETEVIT